MKPLESRVRGTVDSFDKGIGRIRPDGDGDLLFVHWKSILGTGFKRLEADQPVEFVIKDDPRGPKAEQEVLGGAGRVDLVL